MDKLKVDDYLTEEGKEQLKEFKKRSEHNKRKKKVIDGAYNDTQELLRKFRLMETDYMESESDFNPSVKTMIFMRAVNGVAHSHFKTHMDLVSNKLDDEITAVVDEELEKEIEDGSPGDDNSN